QLTSGLLAMVDGMRSRLSVIEATRAEDERDDTEFLARLRGLQAGLSAEPAPPAAASPAPVAKQPEPSREPVAPAPPPPVPVTDADAFLRESLAHAHAGAHRLGTSISVVAPTASIERGEMEADQTLGAGGVPGPTVADTTIRVDVALLDKLMNLVGELVLT